MEKAKRLKDWGRVILLEPERFERQQFNGKIYYRYTGEKYFSKGTKFLHRAVWEFHHGEIPDGFHVHHIDEDRSNNNIDNLECIEGSEHLSHHVQERLKNPKELEKARERMDYAREYANEWHRSKAGKKWHKEQWKNSIGKMEKKTFECKQCGKSYEAIRGGFCSNACKSKWRRESGIDNETRKCIICESEFEANKYTKVVTCGKSCASKYANNRRKK